MRRSEIYAAIDALYEQVPDIPACDGSCWLSCGPVDRTSSEARRAREAGYVIPQGTDVATQAETFWCPALTDDRRCAIYDIRPLICRLWGTMESTRCPKGCVPRGGFLSEEAGNALIEQAWRISDNGRIPLGLMASELNRIGALKGPDASQRGMEVRAKAALPPGLKRPETRERCPTCGFLLTLPEGIPSVGLCSHCSAPFRIIG